MRRFDKLGHVLHEVLSFSIEKISHSASTIFRGDNFDQMDHRKVLVELGANKFGECDEGNACVEPDDKLAELLSGDGDENVGGVSGSFWTEQGNEQSGKCLFGALSRTSAIGVDSRRC